MTKQQIVVQLVAAKIAHSGIIPHKGFLEQCGVAADKIIEMFPEHDYTVAGSPLTISVAGLDDPNSAVSKSLARNFNLHRAK